MNDGVRASSLATFFYAAAAATLVAVAVLTAPSVAMAQLTEEEQKYLEEKREGPSSVYVIAPRVRAIHLPDFLLDAFLERHASTWDGQANLAYGLEFILRDPKSNEFVFSLDWSDLTMKDEWWLQSDKPARQADWTEFDVSLLTLDASYNFWWPISEVFAFYAGAGLGLGVIFGEVTKTDPTQQCILALGETRDTSRLEQSPCEVMGQPQVDQTSTEEEDDIPPVLPILNLTGGFQATIAEHLALRIDFGFKYYLFAGLSIGYQWH